MPYSFIEDVYKSSLKFLDNLTPEETYSQIVHEAMKLVGAEYGSIFLFKDGNLERVYSTIPAKTQINPRKRGFTFESYSKQTVIVVSYKELVKKHPEFKRFKLKSLILTPLAYNKKSFGILSLLSTQENYFDENKTRLLKLMGAMASLAIHKTLLNNDLREALDARDLFIAMMAHELRTPLTTVNLYNQMLNQKKDQPQPRLTEKLNNEIKRLTNVVNQLLENDQIKTNKITYEFCDVDLTDSLKGIEEYFKSFYPKRKLIIHNHIRKNKAMVTGDRHKILQSVTNLLANAAKFSPQSTPIYMDLKKYLDYYQITVKDQGKGIPKKDLDKVCGRFYKGSNHQIEGLGLGLFYVKQVISAHQGSVHILSKINSGTTVEIKLPAKQL